LDVDTADALESSPIERVLIEELSRPAGLHVAESKLHAVAFQKLNLLFGQEHGFVLGVPLESKQSLVTGLEIVSKPNTANSAGTDLYSLKTKFIRYPLRAMSRRGQRILKDSPFNLRRDPIGVGTSRTALRLYQGLNPTHLERSADLVERVSMAPHDFASLRDVPELLGKLQQRKLSSSTLCQG
jgi:hypothetical protein